MARAALGLAALREGEMRRAEELAGAVLAQQAHDGAFGHLERQVVEHKLVAEILGDVNETEHGLGHD